MIYNLAIIFSILFTIFIILLVRNNKLDEKYSILWIIFSVVMIILVLCRGILEKASQTVGIYYAPATLFLIGFVFLIIFIIHLSIVVTKQNKYIIRLTQKVAILDQNLNKKENEIK